MGGRGGGGKKQTERKSAGYCHKMSSGEFCNNTGYITKLTKYLNISFDKPN